MSSTSVLTSSPLDVIITDDEIVLRMSDGSEVSDRFDRYERLRNASPEQLRNWEWTGHRSGIYWPDLDEDLSVHGIVRDDQVRRDAMRRVPMLIADLMRLTDELNRLFPGRKFTPDGHLVGSIGEVVAEHVYDLRLESCSNPNFDARTKDGRTVQIKLTGSKGTSYGIRWSNNNPTQPPDLLLALKLDHTGFTEIFNGPFPTELLLDRKDQSNGQLAISVSRLRLLNPHAMLQVRPLAEFNQYFAFQLDSAA